ncbi:hypothetical protein PVK06_024662 [Gossypium arboreum]|uniref:Uncharacterized protein n=1 Tax=Gossypium arboreum TaxID=29729 RepID=A0ABR0PEF0_GOSAR|nr:hypothetical protein PVK06_024662 [Gossypium arboreum]
MSLCRQKGIVPREDKEVMENKGPINEASIKRMTRGTKTPILKEAGTNKTKKEKAKADKTSLWRKMKDVEKMVTFISNRQIKLVAKIEDMENSQNLFYAYTEAWNSSIVAILNQLSPSPISDFPVFPSTIRNYEHSSTTDDFEDRDRSVASPPIVQVSDNDKDEESKDIEECLCKIDSLFENGIFVDQKDTFVEKEIDASKKEVVVKV